MNVLSAFPHSRCWHQCAAGRKLTPARYGTSIEPSLTGVTMSLTSAVLGVVPNGTAADPLLSSTGTSFTSTLSYAKDTASSTLSYLNPSPKDLVMAVPRLLAYLGSFAFVAIPESIDHFFHLPDGGSVIAEATANKTQAIASAAISSVTTMASASAGGPAATEAAKAGLLGHMSFQHVRSFGGVFSYLTSKWALGCITAVRT